MVATVPPYLTQLKSLKKKTKQTKHNDYNLIYWFWKEAVIFGGEQPAAVPIRSTGEDEVNITPFRIIIFGSLFFNLNYITSIFFCKQKK